MDLTIFLARFVLGIIPIGEFPDIGVAALEGGCDSPSLRMLAGAKGDGNEEIQRILNKVLHELGIQMPTPNEAVILVARDIAYSILQGETTPYEGARKIWWDLYSQFGEPDQLSSFVYFASEYEDDIEHRDEYSQMIIDECKKLLDPNRLRR